MVPTKEPMFLVVAEQLRPMARGRFKGEAVIATGKSCAQSNKFVVPQIDMLLMVLRQRAPRGF